MTQSEFNPADLIYPHNYGVAGQPHKAWQWLRENAPVRRIETGDYPPFWAITKHADIVEISGQPDVFSNSAGPTLLTKREIAETGNQGAVFEQMRTIIHMDPPEHRDFRKVASRFFTARNIQNLDGIVAECAREQVDKLGAEGECDFVEAIAQRHPLRVLATILGINRDDEELVLELTQQLFATEDPDLQRPGEDRREAVKELGMEFFKLFQRIIDDRRANPRDDLASLLANAKLPNGEAMGPMETFGYFLIVFTAGHDTTRNAISGGMEALLQNPEQLQMLREKPELAKPAVEEIVRWTSPVNYMKRLLLRDTEVRGQKLRKGESLVLFYASANRDADVFSAPFRFDITRHPNRHLGFGTGEHFCLGSHVARLSARALFAELAARAVELEPAAAPTQIASSFVVGRKTLPIRYQLKAAA